MPSASRQETFSLSAASATAWMLCFDTPSDLAIALRDVPAASCRSIGLALAFLAMRSSFASLGHGGREPSAARGARRLVSAGGAEAQYGRCRKAITCYRPAGAEARQPQCQYGLILTFDDNGALPLMRGSAIWAMRNERASTHKTFRTFCPLPLQDQAA